MKSASTICLAEGPSFFDVTYREDYQNPRDSKVFRSAKAPPTFINGTSIKEVMDENRRPVDGPRSGFASQLDHHGDAVGARFFETTATQAYSDPNMRLKVDCHHQEHLDTISDCVDDSLYVIKACEIRGHKLEVGDLLLHEGKMEGKQKSDIQKTTLPVLFAFRKHPPHKDDGPNTHFAGLSALEAASRVSGASCGIMTGENYIEEEGNPRSTKVQRSWMVQGDPALFNIAHGGRKPNLNDNSKDCDYYDIQCRLAKTGFLYRNSTDITALGHLSKDNHLTDKLGDR